MKVKLDEHLPHAAVAVLEKARHDVHTVLVEGLGGRKDDVVLVAAIHEGRLLITMDRGFADVPLRTSTPRSISTMWRFARASPIYVGMTTNANQKRRPKGASNGGQFAPDVNLESTVVLDDRPNGAYPADGHSRLQRLMQWGGERRAAPSTVDFTQDAVLAYIVASQTERPEGVDLPVSVIAKRSIIRVLESRGVATSG